MSNMVTILISLKSRIERSHRQLSVNPPPSAKNDKVQQDSSSFGRGCDAQIMKMGVRNAEEV